MGIVVRLSRVLVDRLKRASEAQGVPPEELIVDKLSEGIDPEGRAEVYWEMAEEYLREARRSWRRAITDRPARSYGERQH